MATITKITLLDLVQAINELCTSETETVATIAYLVNSGKVRLGGNFAGATIDLAPPRRTSHSFLAFLCELDSEEGVYAVLST